MSTPADMMHASSHDENQTTAPQTALITGAGSGIGHATAEIFLKNNWNVILIGRKAKPLLDIEERAPLRALALPCDLTSAAQVAALIKRIATADVRAPFDRLLPGTLRALINNAGIFERAFFVESDDQLWQSLLETNLLAPVRLSRLTVPLLEQNGGGVIVNVSSTLGLRPVPQTAAYSASKAAMLSWTQTLALEVAAKKIRVNCVCPGIVDTPIHGFHANTSDEERQQRAQADRMQPLGRIGRPMEIAQAIFNFCGPGSEWTTGAALAIDGGISLL